MMWGCIAYATKQCADVMTAYAGKTSTANVLFGLNVSINVALAFSVAVSGVAVTLYIREARLHRKTRERLAGRITELELLLDPSRKSSKLTTEGLTRKEDE